VPTDPVSPLGRSLLLARTAGHLRPAQVAHRLRLRALRVALARRPEWFARRWTRPAGGAAGAGWPAGFVALDRAVAGGCPSPEANLAGRFRFLGEERDLGHPIDWDAPGAGQLWRYHLHYLEWAWSLLAVEDRSSAKEWFATLFRSWADGTTYGRWDAWSPYVVAVRTWVLCDLHAPLVAGGPLEPDYVRAIAAHGGYVAANLELDVGGNHLVKNLKALVGAGVFLGDDELVTMGCRHLARQLRVQVLPDGGHFERSPAYHAQVLGDLVDIAGLLQAAGRPVPAGLGDAVTAMRRWLGAMVLPDGDVPLLNDAWRLGPARLAALGPLPADGARVTVLEPSGYVVARVPPFTLVADVGPPCPDELPAHAQADTLTFELCVGDRRVVVDPGTSTYEGARRAWERSTPAHSTVTVDGRDSTEVWGRFRAARRARAVLEVAHDDGTTVEIAGSHDGYERRRDPVRHRRTWRVGPGGVEIVDDLDGTGVHDLTWTLVVAPDTRLGVSLHGPDPVGAGGSHDHASDTARATGTATTKPGDAAPASLGEHAAPASLEEDAVEVATGFGSTTPARRLRRRARTALPARFVCRLTIPGAD
jgi:uncharacterized heparinase superfamily protein